MMKIGFGCGFYRYAEISQLEQLQRLLAVDDGAVELMFGNTEYVSTFDAEAEAVFKKFSYRSIHFPCNVRYPSAGLDEVWEKMMEIANRTEAHTLVVHPDLVDDWEWVADNFDSRLAIENMDTWHESGSQLSEMVEVFAKVPQAKWVFDVNHLYTLDSSMEMVGEFYGKLGDRLAHYHVSGVQDRQKNHMWLQETGQAIICQEGIRDLSKPIIIESTAYGEDQIAHPEIERDYIQKLLG